MDLKNLIAKLRKAEPLNALEESELENFDWESCSEANLDRLRREHDDLRRELDDLRRRARMEKLCAELHCTDPDYLEFRARQSRVDLDDPEAVRDFAVKLAAASPGCFQARIAPGSSAGTAPAAPAAGPGDLPGDRIGAIAASIVEAPDAR